MDINEKSKRINTIDRLRGVSILFMILANYFKEIEWIPKWMKHASPYGLTIVDFIAPCFFFLIGLTFYISFYSRLIKDGKKAALRHLHIRALALYGIGSLLSTLEMFSNSDEVMRFNILQAIGLSTLAVIPFLKSSLWVKVTFGILIGIGAHFLLIKINGVEYMLVEARAIGVIGWISFLLLCLAMADLFFKCNSKRKYYLYCVSGVSMILIGGLLSSWIPIYHSAATLSYNLITIGTISILFILMYLMTEQKFRKRVFLCHWGSNPLIIFIVHFLLLILFKVLLNRELINIESIWIFTISSLIYLVIIQGLIIILKRKKAIISI